MAERRKNPDLGVIIALTWVMVAIALTALYGPTLGLRGWIWLGVHHALCAIGAAHELRRGWRRRQLSRATPEPAPPV